MKSSVQENVFPEGTAVPKPPRSHVALAKAKAAALRPKAVGKSKGKAKHLAEPEARQGRRALFASNRTPT